MFIVGQCAPGWTGPNCNIPCPENYFGQSCSQMCKCKNGAKCRKNDGYCICNEGFMGAHCDDICPEGFYGKHCMETCSCPSPQFVCHAAHGCVCRIGFSGVDCLTPHGRSQELSSSCKFIKLQKITFYIDRKFVLKYFSF